jgi:DNA-binding CsgD family transcriptional regulator
MPRPPARPVQLPKPALRELETARLRERFVIGPKRAEVLLLILYGITSDKEIARYGGISQSRAHEHVQQLMVLFEVDSRARLVHEATRQFPGSDTGQVGGGS